MPTPPTPASSLSSLPGQSRTTVLVTGASRGIGRAIAQAFGQAGWAVGIHYRERRHDAEQTLATIVASGGIGSLLQADIRHANEVQALVRDFLDRWGRLDVLVCNAGIATSRLVARQSPDDWSEVIDTNLTGTFRCLKAAAVSMIAQNDGSIIVVGSHASIRGTAGQAAYAASKAGLLGLMHTAAREWGDANVRINVVFPGWQRTGLSGLALPDSGAFADHTLKRPPNLEAVARSIYHLALLKDVSGQVWNLDSRGLWV